jgi:hypothetical protein
VSNDEAFHLEAIMGFYLVRKGDVIHRSNCRYAEGPRAQRWTWADNNPDVDWARSEPGVSLHTCSVCLPPSPWTDGVE